MIGFIEGWDYTTVAQGSRKWDNATGAIVTGYAGNGSALSGPIAKVISLGVNYATGWVSFDYYTGQRSTHTILSFLDTAATQCDLRITGASGFLTFTRNGTVLGTSTLSLSALTWYSIVVKATINDSTGALEIRVGGVSAIALTGIDSKNGANAYFNQLSIDSNADRSQAYDNFIFWNTTVGAVGSNDLSDWPTSQLTVDTALVTGAGADAQWTPSTGSNYQNVDEATANDDTDYNASATPTQVDTFTVGNLRATSGTVIAIGVNTVDRIDDATPRTVSHRVNSSSVVTDGTAFSPSATYKNHQTIFTLDPNTTLAPTISARNAMKFGYKEVS